MRNRNQRAVAFIYEFIDPCQKEAAKKIEVSQSMLSNIQNGKRNVSMSLLSNLIINHRLNANWYFRGRGRKRLIERHT